MKNLSPITTDNGYAVFLPAISGFYTTMLAKILKDPNYAGINRVPAGFENGFEGLDFLNMDKGYFTYKYALYSAGHAELDIQKATDKEPMILKRNRKDTILVADSGGFQIGKGVIKFDWEHFYETPNDPKYIGEADRVRLKILRWLEHTSDYAMILDVPSWASNDLNKERTGMKSFEDCLDATLFNNDFFLKHRKEEATKFLNVLQGGNWEECQHWYEKVKDYPFNGWAMGAANMRNLSIALRRIIVLRDEKKLEKGQNDWMHFLGTSKLDWACLLTQVQRQVRKNINEDFTISFDCASPYIACANALVYTSPVHTNDRNSYIMKPFPDNKDFKNTKIPLPFESEIFSRLTTGDIAAYGHGDLNKIGREGKTSWDTVSYLLVMAHNTYQHIRAVQQANQYLDIESMRFKPDVRHWKRLRNNDKSDEMSDYVPRNLLYFSQFVEELFTTENPMDLIENNQMFIQEFNNKTASSSSGGIFNTLFDNSITEADDSTFGDNESEKLEELEKIL